MDRPGQVSEFQIRVSPAFNDATAMQKLCSAIEALSDAAGNPFGFKAMLMRDFVAADTETRLLLGMAKGTSAIAIFLSALGVLNTMLMSVIERTRELGILRAVGWSRTLIVRLILGESFLISLSGVVLGTALAWSGVFALARCSFTQTLVPGGLAPAAIAVGATVGILAGLGGAIYPALRATCVDPMEALRYE